MPELPELELLKEEMSRSLVSRKIERVFVRRGADMSGFIEFDLFTSLEDSTVTGVDRRGSVMIFHLDNKLTFLIMMRTNSDLILTKLSNYRDSETGMVLDIDNGYFVWATNIDMRNVSVTSTAHLDNHEFFDHIGLDPLDDINVDEMKKRLRAQHGMLKNVLMSQTVINGLGTVYTDEILYQAGLHPAMDTGTIRRHEVDAIVSCMKRILSDAIRFGGISYNVKRHGSNTGMFDEHLLVHHRSGQPCYNCTTPIRKIRFNGRSAYICPNCQRWKRR